MLDKKWLNHRVSAFVVCVLLVSGLTFFAGCAREYSDAEHVQKAKDYFDKGDLRTGVVELKNALQKNPDNSEARWLLGTLYVDSGLGAPGEKELRRALELGTSKDAVFVPLARALLLQAEYKKLLSEFNNLSQLSGKVQSDLHALRADAYMAQGKLKDAENELKQAFIKNPESRLARVEKARLIMIQRDFDGAREQLNKLLSESPGFEPGWRLKGDLESYLGNLSEADSAYTKAVETRTENRGALLKRVFVRLTLNNLDGAENDIRLLKQLMPRYHRVLLAEGMLDIQKGDHDKAYSMLEQSLKLAPDHMPTVYYMGVLNFSRGQMAQAENNISRVLFAHPRHMAARKLLARIHIYNKDFQNADKTIAPVLEKNPDDIDALTLHGIIKLASGADKEGVISLEKVLKLQPENAAAHLRLGLAMLKKGENEKGLKELGKAVSLAPENSRLGDVVFAGMLKAQAYDEILSKAKVISGNKDDSAKYFNNIGIAHLAKGNNKKAQEAFNNALKIEPGDPIASHNLARIEIAQGNKEAAIDYYRNVLKVHPDHLDTRLALARMELQQGDTGKAQELLEAAAKKYPNVLQAQLTLARYYLRFGRAAESLAIMQTAQTRYQGNPDILEVMGEAQLEISQPRNAERTLERLIQIRPGVAQYRYLLARAYDDLGKNDKLKHELNAVLKLHPKHILARVGLSRMYMKDNRQNEANRIYNELEREHPSVPEVLALKGWLAVQQQRPAEAVAAYRLALKSYKNSRWTVRLAHAQWQAGDKAGASQTLETWLSQFPEDYLVMFTLADIYLNLQQHVQAIKLFKRLVKLNPDNLVVLNNLAWLLRKDDPGAALKYAERAYSQAPGQAEVTDTLALVLMEQGKSERAARLLGDVVKREPKNKVLRFHYAQALLESGDKTGARAVLDKLLAEPGDFPERQAAERLYQTLEH